MLKPALRAGVVYDFRNPPDSGIETPRLYAEILDQVTWLDGLGLDLVWFTEHHFVDDGYLPSWTPVAAAGFGIPLPQRVSRAEEGLAVLRRCFTGERFSFHGTRYHFDDVLIRPGYMQPGGPPLWLGAMSEGGARRAARFDCHLLPQGPRDQVLAPWHDALQQSGRDRAAYRVGIIRGCLATDDRDRDWPAVRAAERYRGQLYSRFFAGSGRFQPVERDGPRIPQTWVVGDVESWWPSYRRSSPSAGSRTW